MKMKMKMKRERESPAASDLPELDHRGIRARRNQTSIEHALGEEADPGPVGIELPGEDEIGEHAEHGGFLGAGGVAGGFIEGLDVASGVHVELAAIEHELAARQAELALRAGEGQ